MDGTGSVLETEAAHRVGLIVRAEGYELQVVPGHHAADLGAARNGVVWATFHVAFDAKRPLLLRIGATVWGGARQDLAEALAYDDPAAGQEAGLAAFVQERLSLACRRGLSQDPGHCESCPRRARHEAGDFRP